MKPKSEDDSSTEVGSWLCFQMGIMQEKWALKPETVTLRKATQIGTPLDWGSSEI